MVLEQKNCYSIYYLYFIFIVYGSLVPLNYSALSLDQALTNFQNIRYLTLGIESRADWIANILLYIPLAFLGLANFRNSLQKGIIAKALIVLLVLAFCLATAIGIEFTQQFFPPRTVSLNDLIAETLGSMLGVGLWLGFGDKLFAYGRQITFGSWLSLKSAIILFLPFYLFLSLFPFDFVTSSFELNNKLASGHDSWWIDIDDCLESPFRCTLKWAVEIGVLMPLGALFAALPYVPNRKGLAVVVGFLLGFFIEIIQIFIFSASAQGFSIVTRMLGMGLGVKAYGFFTRRDFEALKPWIVWGIGLSLIPYVVLVAAINGWVEGGWITQTAALQKLAETNFLPFYYFYYTTETVALVSLLSNVGAYLPVGVLFWLNGLRNPHSPPVKAGWVGLVAALFAVVIEGGKLFLKAKHVDPTDVLLAFFAAVFSYKGLLTLQGIRQKTQRGSPKIAPSFDQEEVRGNRPHHHFPNVDSENGDNEASSFYDPIESPEATNDALYHDSKDSSEVVNTTLTINRTALIPVMFIGCAIGYAALHYPLYPLALMLGLLIYAWVLWLRPHWSFLLLLALLPVLDLAPWSGRFFFDEFDLLVLTTLAVLGVRSTGKPRSNYRPRVLVWVPLIGFGVLLLVSLVIGLWPFPAIDANAFSQYYSPYNGLRIVKGFFWAALLSPFWLRTLQDKSQRIYVTAGCLMGLFALGVFSLIERWVFPGVLDVNTDYRINALFSTMHTGGGHIESYLALVMPFIAMAWWSGKQYVWAYLLASLLFLMSLYTLLMTYSRGGAIGLGVGLVVLLTAAYLHFRQQLQLTKTLLVSLSVVLIVLLSAVPVFKGELMQHRIQVAQQDSQSRHQHWLATIDMMGNDFVSQAFGMGLGSFPRHYFWSNQQSSVPATYSISAENNNQFLKLRGGDALFLGQYISLKALAHQALTVSMDLRSPQGNGSLSVPICEKSLQYSFKCISTEFKIAARQWFHVEKSFDSQEVGVPSNAIATGILTRPVQLALYAGGDPNTVLEIDNLRLTDAQGNDLLANGDFSSGLDRWFFSTERHNPWHVFNLWVQVLFDMGWSGLIVLLALLLSVYYRLLRALRHDSYAPILLASFTGFLVIGYVDSPFDAPRLSFLFFLLVVFALFGCKTPSLSSRVN